MTNVKIISFISYIIFIYSFILCFKTDSNEFARWSNKHPEHWSSQEVLDWVFYAAEKNGIDCEHLYAENFRNIAGINLCKMGLEGFLRLEPTYGRLFYKMFRDLCDGCKFLSLSF